MSKKIEFKHISIHEGPEQSPGYLLWRISTSWRSSIENTLKSLSLTHPQFVVLATLGWLTRNGDKVNQLTVGNLAGLDPNTTSQILRGLEKKKLIQRQTAQDSREKNPLLTPKGIELLKIAMPIVEKKDAYFFEKLSSQELEMLNRLFIKLID